MIENSIIGLIGTALSIELIAFLTLVFKSKQNEFKISLNQITLVVPFKNEYENLSNFILWLEKHESLPYQIIFVNDHSSDQGANLIKNGANRKCVLLSLPEDKKGKKNAIRYAIEKCETSFVLTMDADVIPVNNYFKSIEKEFFCEFNVLPVKMNRTSNSVASFFATTEYNLLQALNYLFSKQTVLTASGANLLFSKSKFEEVDDIEKHEHILSGDDHYLLRAFQKSKAHIKVLSDQNITVYTNSVNDFKSFYKQRCRWLGKLFIHSSSKDWIAGFIFFGYFVSTTFLILALLFQQKWSVFFVTFIALTLLYLFPMIIYNRGAKLVDVFKAIMMTIFYPILFLSIVVMSLFYKNKKW
jgi:cellulose synthase/poly-beta-1,6-N-acetylglucosamine synthase-like glycosyltransferase